MAHPTGDRGFNTIQNSNVQKREMNQALQKYTLFGVVSLAALTIVMVIIMALGAIITNLSGTTNKGPDNERVDWGSITVTATDTLQGDLVLVNNTHVYTFPQSTDHLKEIYAVYATHTSPRPYVLSGLSKYMDSRALAAMDAMLTDFSAATGKNDVQIRYAYRSYEDQKSFSVQPGYSDHHTGLGCQLKYVVESGNNIVAYDLSLEPVYNWLFDNCHKYGFVVRYPADKTDKTGIEDYASYFRYVGVAHATYMKEQNLCMEEYIEVLKNYTDESPLKINAADGRYYEVWYVAVNGSATVKHPTNYAYTVSGTNEGGVVVTVDRSKALESEAETTVASDTAAG